MGGKRAREDNISYLFCCFVVEFGVVFFVINVNINKANY